MDRMLGELGAERIYDIGEGDELCGQEESFRTWAKDVFKVCSRSVNTEVHYQALVQNYCNLL